MLRFKIAFASRLLSEMFTFRLDVAKNLHFFGFFRIKVDRLIEKICVYISERSRFPVSIS
jgi:hypothetical protein